MLANPSFGITRTVPIDFTTAVAKVRETLAAEGFGVLTEIDMAGTLKKKLGHEMRPYLILGACHPASALAALKAEPAIGLLLPCNVVVTVDDDGHAVIGAIDPEAMFAMVKGEGMEAVVEDVRGRLTRALDAVA
jgi:uncharacterized protein (DUF302 family)